MKTFIQFLIESSEHSLKQLQKQLEAELQSADSPEKRKAIKARLASIRRQRNDGVTGSSSATPSKTPTAPKRKSSEGSAGPTMPRDVISSLGGSQADRVTRRARRFAGDERTNSQTGRPDPALGGMKRTGKYGDMSDYQRNIGSSGRFPKSS